MLIKLALKYNVHTSFLTYIGFMVGLNGVKVYLFNVEDSKHPKYKSTIGYKDEKSN